MINTSTLRVNLTPYDYHEDDQDYHEDDHATKEISRTKMISIWLDLIVNLGQRIFGKDAKPG